MSGERKQDDVKLGYFEVRSSRLPFFSSFTRDIIALPCTLSLKIYRDTFAMAALLSNSARVALRSGASASSKAGAAGLAFARGKATLPDLSCKSG